MDEACNTQSILRCVVLDRMSACKNCACLQYFVCASLEDLAQDLGIHLLRKRYDIQCGLWFAAHRVDITQGIRRCDLSEIIRIICHRRKEIQSLDHCQFV